MARFTREELQAQIANLLARGVVYKVEVDEVKHSVSWAYDAATGKLLQVMERRPGVDPQRENPHSKSDTELYYSVPSLLAHMYGAKFNKLLAATEDSAYKRAVVALKEEWKSIHEGMQQLQKIQTFGRRPAINTKKVIGTRIQMRAICSCCFRQHAIVSGNIAEHGFRLMYESRNGSCYGSGKPHFGTEDGMRFAKALAENHRETARLRYARADATLIGEAKILDKVTRKPIENPTERQINNAVEILWDEAENHDWAAKLYEEKVNEWMPVDPVPVEVEVFE